MNSERRCETETQRSIGFGGSVLRMSPSLFHVITLDGIFYSSPILLVLMEQTTHNAHEKSRPNCEPLKSVDRVCCVHYLNNETKVQNKRIT
jgi:hypothetical protein